MYLRRCRKRVAGNNYVYWQLVESCRTERGPRQRVVAYLADMDQSQRLGVAQVAKGKNDDPCQESFFADDVVPEWVEINVSRVRVERVLDFGAYWLGLQIMHGLGLPEVLDSLLERGREDIPWSVMAMLLVLMRLADPSSELKMAEHLFERVALGDLLGIPSDKINDDRLYRTLDQLLPHKNALQKHLKERLGRMFNVKYDLLLYDITSTYFEGECAENESARFGYSRDKRPDCKQVCIALVVSREGIPLGYELLAGNRVDVTTVKEIVEKIESQYGKADRIWVMDRGMISKKSIEFLGAGDRQYIVGSTRSQLRQFQEELSSSECWETIGEGLAVKLIAPEGSKERFVLCRSVARGAKERAMLERFATRIEEGLQKLAKACAGKRKLSQSAVDRRIGALLNQNSRARGLFKVKVGSREDGGAMVEWQKLDEMTRWAELKRGCYILRTNVEGSAGELWQSYIQLGEVESAFRIEKSDLRIRPIWHQKEERVAAHILVCFLAYVLWKTLAQMCKAAGLGTEPRKVIDELAGIKMVDVVMPTRSGVELRRRCVSEPTKAQAILLSKLKLRLPKSVAVPEQEM